MKVKIGLDHDLEALSLIRSSVGDDVRIRVDANQGYSRPATRLPACVNPMGPRG